MRIIDLLPDNEQAIEEAAALLVEGFAEHWPGSWPDLQSARDEVRQWLAPEHICRAAVDEHGSVLGWVGGNSQYDGNVWELHPLVVRAGRRGEGIGRALVADLEARVRERGGITILLGTDDVDDQTSLSGVDLYPNLMERIANIRNRRGHPFEFYQKVGFRIVGVVPDANGFGKPDILMAKRVSDPTDNA
jgi:aminoglycoside 6'-N-acetyltransferase I